MQRVLVAGATGALGPHLVKALRENGKETYALVRPETLATPAKTEPLKALGVHLVSGDLNDPDSLRRACEGMDAVISALGPAQIPLQAGLFAAAKEAGVSRVIPSEFGFDTVAAGLGACDLFDIKVAAQQSVRESGLNYTMIYSNGFMEFWGGGLGELGHMAPPAEVSVFGEGAKKISLTAMDDIARYTVAILDDPEAANQEVVILNNLMSQEELIAAWERISGRQVRRKPVSAEELEQIINSSTTPETFMTRVLAQLHQTAWVRGGGDTARPGTLLAHERYPEIQVRSVEDFFSSVAQMTAAV